jgi:hypothetical protein
MRSVVQRSELRDSVQQNRGIRSRTASTCWRIEIGQNRCGRTSSGLSWNEEVLHVVTTTIKSSEQVTQNMAGLMQNLKLWAGMPNKHLLSRNTSAFSMVDG